MEQDSTFSWSSGLQSAWQQVSEFLPKFGLFLLILLIGWVVAKVLAKVTDTVLERVGFDRAVERGGIKQALARSRYDASDLVAKLVYYTVLLFVLAGAFSVFGSDNAVSRLLGDVIAFLPRVIVAIVIVVIASAIAKAVKDIVTNVLGGVSYGNALGTAAAIFIVGLGVISALQQVRIMETVSDRVLTAVLAAVVGIAVIGVGGGLVMPMSRRWERWLDAAESEAGRVRSDVRQNQGAASATVRGYAEQANDTPRHAGGDTAPGTAAGTPAV